jgi:hypothetical protein
MAKAPQTNSSRVTPIGSDRVTFLGENILIETRRTMLDWEVRELNPVPIYFEEGKYLLVQKQRGHGPFAVRYFLKPWPKELVSNSIRFLTYDLETVTERDRQSQMEKVDRTIYLILLPFYPLLGLLWSPLQDRLADFGFAPRTMTRLSIFAVLLFILPTMLLLLMLGGIPIMALLFGLLSVTGLVDSLMRIHFSFRDEGWRGGFLEWLFPIMNEFPSPTEIKTPGLLASVETLIFSKHEPGLDSKTTRLSFRLPPIIERELRIALRRQKPVRRRFRLAAACTGGALLASVLAGQSAGREFHVILCLAACYLVMTVPHRIAGFLSAERREQTLGLLFISGLSSKEIFLSKTISAAAIVFSDFLAIVPVFALPFLMGGVTFELFLATIWCWPNVLLFALAVSLLASVLCEDEGTAVVFTVVLGVFLVGFPSAIYLAQNLLSNGSPPWSWLLLCNPAYGPWLVFGKFSAAQASAFWGNSLVTLCGSAISLCVAGLVLNRLWRQREEQGLLYRWRETWRTLVHGTFDWRKRLALEWLPTNPCMWLAARDRAPLRLAWVILGTLVSIWLVCWAVWPDRWLSVANFFITANVLNLTLRWLIHYVAAANVGLRRRDGHYELLLTTALSPAAIVEGQLAALRFQFRQIFLLTFALQIIMMFAGIWLRTWDASSLSAYFALWFSLLFWEWQQSWNFLRTTLSMWAGLNSVRPLQVVWRVTGFNAWIWVWVLFNLRQGANGMPSGSFPELLFLLVVLFILFGLWLRSKLENNVLLHRLDTEFREIVREPIPDPRDSRFKQWNIRERFPWGWSLVQSQLHERIARRQSV